ncbi:MAG: hypothetical protein HFE64_02625 [Lachnospiraceae bacterium]|jgi:hypothetical protein|nr:hypothetical protein [Lachnospiraceae bacterium]
MDIWQQRIIEEVKTYRKGARAEQFTLTSLKRVERELERIYKGSQDPNLAQEPAAKLSR